MAVSVAVVAAKDVIDVNMLDCGIVVGVGVACRVIRCEHDGTPEGIACAALTAWHALFERILLIRASPSSLQSREGSSPFPEA